MTISNISSIQNLDTSSFIVDNSISFSFLNTSKKDFKQEKYREREIENSRRSLNLRKSKVMKSSAINKGVNVNQYKLKEGINDIKIQYERTLSKKRYDSKETVKITKRLPSGKKMTEKICGSKSKKSSPEKTKDIFSQVYICQNFQNVIENMTNQKNNGSPLSMTRPQNTIREEFKEEKKRNSTVIKPSEMEQMGHQKDQIISKINNLNNNEDFQRNRRSPLKVKPTKGFVMKKKSENIGKSHNLMKKKRLKRESIGSKSRKNLNGSGTGLTQTFGQFLSEAKIEFKKNN